MKKRSHPPPPELKGQCIKECTHRQLHDSRLGMEGPRWAGDQRAAEALPRSRWAGPGDGRPPPHRHRGGDVRGRREMNPSVGGDAPSPSPPPRERLRVAGVWGGGLGETDRRGPSGVRPDGGAGKEGNHVADEIGGSKIVVPKKAVACNRSLCAGVTCFSFPFWAVIGKSGHRARYDCRRWVVLCCHRGPSMPLCPSTAHPKCASSVHSAS